MTKACNGLLNRFGANIAALFIAANLAPVAPIILAQENPSSASVAGAVSRPNIIIILADDLGYGDVSIYRQGEVNTPFLKRLADEGMIFSQMRANATVCSPSRAALLTGKYADRVGVPGVIRTAPEDSWGYFDPQAQTLGDHLRQAGYHTALIGKWHLGLESPNLPNERGFDLFRGFLGDMMDSYWDHRRHGHNYMRENGETIDPPGHASELFADWACEYLQQRATEPDKPFLLYLAWNAPHFPIEPPQSFVDEVSGRFPQLAESRVRNIALVEHLDQQLGRVLQTLSKLGMEDNTLVAFSSDNGGSLPHAQNNDPWREGKQSHFDGGLKVPFVIRYPNAIAAGSRSEYQGLLFDLFPTALDVAGLPIPKDLDAVSLTPLFGSASNPAKSFPTTTPPGQPMPEDRELYFVRREGGPAYGGKSYEALIRGPWKLMQNNPYSPQALYHLQDDPGELTNRIDSAPALLRSMQASLRAHIQRGGAIPWQKDSSRAN